jgi:DNA-binding SARP family transcriptional activator
MHFRVLGPLEASANGDRVSLGGAKPRAVLTVLLLHRNEVVSNDLLIEALWGERPPDNALKTLQVHVSQLRKAIAAVGGSDAKAGPIRTHPPGYLLKLASGDLDLDRFRQLHGDARAVLASDPARAARLLGEALRLWRGPPLADFTYERFAQEEIARLEQLRLAAVEDRVEAELSLGRHADVVGALEPLVATHPLRERLRAQLMVALYRSGRQADALESYHAGRVALTGELGINPGRELRELQQAILRQSPELEHPAGEAPVGRASRGAFVGRTKELGKLVAALEDAMAARGRVVLVGGEPGIGKSRLADEAIRVAHTRGAVAHVGRCWEAGGAPAFWPWVQSLRSYVRASDQEELRAQLGSEAAVLAQLLPELRELLPDLSEPPALEAEGARFRLFEAVTVFLRRAAETRPLLLVFDDLHAADAPSLVLLRYVAREIGTSRLLLICSFRDADPTVTMPLSSTLAELVREPHTARITLAGLSQHDIAEYIDRTSSSVASPGVIEAVHGETGGNPFFLTEVVRLLDAEASPADADAHISRLPDVRAVIARRVERLSAPCQRLLVLASVLGREFGVDALGHFAELTRTELLDVLDEAMAERIVDDVPGLPGRLRFGHALIRDTLYDELTAARRLELHQRAGEALESAYGIHLEPHMAELAHHFLAAATGGAAEKAVDYARRAGDRAAEQLAYEEAARLFMLGLALAREPTARCELLLALGDAEARAGDSRASKRTFREAAALAEASGLAEQLARAALGYGGRIIFEPSRHDQEWMPLLERALTALGDEDSRLRVKVLARLSGGPLRDASFGSERRVAVSREALDMARRLDDPATLAFALDAYIPANETPGNTRELIELATELRGLAIDTGDKELALEAQEHLLGRFLELGDPTGASTALERMTQLADELRQPSQRWLVGACSARNALLEGRLRDAETQMEDALAAGEPAHTSMATNTFRVQLYVLRREQGRLDEMQDLVRRSVEEYPTYSLWRCVLTHMHAELGHLTESRTEFDALAPNRFSALPFDEEWLVSMVLLAEAATLLEDERSEVLYDMLLPYGDRLAVSYPEISIGAVARHLALLATTIGRPDDAVRHFEHALDVNGRMNARPWLARTRDDYGRMLLSRGRGNDRDRAYELRATAAAEFELLGMKASSAASAAFSAAFAEH